MPYDAAATGVTGFAFNITGAMVPTTLRFKVEDATGEYCTPSDKRVVAGANSFVFADLRKECWTTGGASGDMAKSALLKIAWQVVTTDAATVPFDFCVSDIRALQ